MFVSSVSLIGVDRRFSPVCLRQYQSYSASFSEMELELASEGFKRFYTALMLRIDFSAKI